MDFRSVIKSAIPVLAVIGFALLTNLFTGVSGDLGWILAYGRVVFESGSIPQLNDFSFTEPLHTSVLSEWLFCLIAFLFFKLAGGAGLIALKWIFIAACATAIDYSVKLCTSSNFIRFLVSLVSASALWISFEGIRAQYFSLLFLSLLLILLIRGSRSGRWFAIPIMFVWASCHGAFPLGIFILFLHAGMSVITSKEKLISAFAVPVLATLTTILNPFGLEALLLSFQHLNDPALRFVNEWQPLWQMTDKLWLVICLVVLVILSFPFMWRRHLFLWVLLFIGSALAISAIRHVRFLPMFLSPGVTVLLSQIFDKLNSDVRFKLNQLVGKIAGLVCILSTVILLGQIGDIFKIYDRTPESVAPAIEFMRVNQLTGNIWNDFDWGGYVLWRIPGAKVACDGRAITSYSSEFLETCIPFGYYNQDVLAILSKYSVDYILLPPQNPAMDKISTQWKKLYCDDEACVLAKPEKEQSLKSSLKIPEKIKLSDFF